jgi:hypothetical protein
VRNLNKIADENDTGNLRMDQQFGAFDGHALRVDDDYPRAPVTRSGTSHSHVSPAAFPV